MRLKCSVKDVQLQKLKEAQKFFSQRSLCAYTLRHPKGIMQVMIFLGTISVPISKRTLFSQSFSIQKKTTVDLVRKGTIFQNGNPRALFQYPLSYQYINGTHLTYKRSVNSFFEHCAVVKFQNRDVKKRTVPHPLIG